MAAVSVPSQRFLCPTIQGTCMAQDRHRVLKLLVGPSRRKVVALKENPKRSRAFNNNTIWLQWMAILI